MFASTWKVVGIVSVLATLVAVPARAVPVSPIVGTPGVHGDQLIFFFDARADRVPFLTVSNLALTDVRVEIAYYPQDLGRTLAAEKRTVVALGNLVLDPTRVTGVSGRAGLAVVTPIGGSPERPVVPPAAGIFNPTPPLFGSFTLANTKLGAGFGQNPMGRTAVDRRGERPPDGTPVDGFSVRYQRFAPEALVVPTYFRPSDLAPADRDGNRIVLGTFRDGYGATFRLRPGDVSFDAFFDDATGQAVGKAEDLRVSGVHLDTLGGLAGVGALRESGKILFASRAPIPDDTNLFGLVAQALGTFSVGQQMPGIFLTDQDDEKIVFVAGIFGGANFGGLGGADALCQAEADAAGLPGTFLAWLSDSKESPSTRFQRATVPYVLPNGTRIADDWADLTSGAGPDFPIEIRADGSPFVHRFVYTNTSEHGAADRTDPSTICDDWTSTTNAAGVRGGDTRAIGTPWTNDRIEPCGSPTPIYGIYCFEQ